MGFTRLKFVTLRPASKSTIRTFARDILARGISARVDEKNSLVILECRLKYQGCLSMWNALTPGMTMFFSRFLVTVTQIQDRYREIRETWLAIEED